MDAKYEIEPLGEAHDRAQFTSGVEALDRFFRERAGQEMRRNVSVVYVLRMAGESTVAGYYTLSATSVEPTGLPADIVKRLPRYPTLPAILIGRLALDQRYQGQGLGRTLLVSALGRSLKLSTYVGAIAVIVDAKHEAARHFYERSGFRSFVDDPNRLFLMMTTISKMVTDQGATDIT